MSKRDVTQDFLLCNRCGTCRSVCPLLQVCAEEWAGARGKVEIAEAFFRGESIEASELRKVFDLCLHCMMCEENCPSGVRAQEIVSAARAAMARRGMMSQARRIALRVALRMDDALFAMARALGLARRAALHGVGGRSALGFLFPLLGWPRERFVPLPAAKPFLSRKREMYRAQEISVSAKSMDSSWEREKERELYFSKAKDLAKRVLDARERNLAAKRTAYFFVGHAVNQFFPEEGLAVARLLNVLGIDVLAPADQVCCGAPVYWAGDMQSARDQAMKVIEHFEGRKYDWIVSSCASGTLMLKEEFPRLFDLCDDGYFEIEWDADTESLRRVPDASAARKRYPRAEDLYRTYIEGKLRDVNELVAQELGLSPGLRREQGLRGEAGELGMDQSSGQEPNHGEISKGLRPVVTYHHPCHLARGQDVDWQPEAILESLPGFGYVRMKDADRCCGGGGAFSFLHADESQKIARAKVDAIEKSGADVVATACPLCRIQLMDMLSRSHVRSRRSQARRGKPIPVTTPVELLLEELEKVLQIEYRADRASSRGAR
ncbi:MAG: (Fe-S)-binding protein [candidate division WOR-3 bacterium]